MRITSDDIFNNFTVHNNNEHNLNDDGDVTNENVPKKDQSKDRNKKGIIYISSIPKYMNVTQLRELMQQFGEIGRIFLQPADNKNKKKKHGMQFTEGWVEFKKKRVAKQVASTLNNKQIGVPKKSKYYDYIWNIKYLSGLKWVHLNERLAYEKAVHKQRMRAEIAQAKKEAMHFSIQADTKKKTKHEIKQNVKNSLIQQRKPDDSRKTVEYDNIKHKDEAEVNRSNFLKSLFTNI